MRSLTKLTIQSTYYKEWQKKKILCNLFLLVCMLADSGFLKNFLYQDGVKSIVSWVLEDLKFKISEGYDQNWWFPDSAQLLTGQSQETTNLGPNLLKF